LGKKGYVVVVVVVEIYFNLQWSWETRKTEKTIMPSIYIQ